MHFARTLETSNGNLNFYFNKIFTATGERFHISVVANNKSVTILMDQDKQGKWHMINKEVSPHWIQELEEKLKTVIMIATSSVK